MSSIESKLEQIEQAIQKQIAERKDMGKVTRTFAIIGGVCLAGVVLVKAPIFILGAGAAFAGAAVTEMIRGRKSEQLSSMYETQAALMIAQEAGRKGQEPAPAQDLKGDGLKNGFGKNADRVEKLAEDVEALKEAVEGKPVELDKSKGTFGRFYKK